RRNLLVLLQTHPSGSIKIFTFSDGLAGTFETTGLFLAQVEIPLKERTVAIGTAADQHLLILCHWCSRLMPHLWFGSRRSRLAAGDFGVFIGPMSTIGQRFFNLRLLLVQILGELINNIFLLL